MTDRDWMINVMRYWYNASPLAALGFVKFTDALAHYEVNPSFATQFGKAARLVPQTKAKAGMEELARRYQTKYPPQGEFFNALGTAVQTWDSNDTKEVVAETATGIANLAGLGLGMWALAVGVGIVIFFSNAGKGAAKAAG